MSTLTNDEPKTISGSGDFFFKVSTSSGTVTFEADVDDGKGFEELTDDDGVVLSFSTATTGYIELPVCTFRAKVSGDSIFIKRK